MASRPVARVTLSGYRSGEYVVTEERDDGSLVLAPADEDRQHAARRSSNPLAGKQFRSQQTKSLAEILDGWGVKLGREEQLDELLVVDVDGESGFAACTNQRFIFVAETEMGPGVAVQRLLSSVSSVEVVRRGIRQKLLVRWAGYETLIGASDKDALARLHAALERR